MRKLFILVAMAVVVSLLALNGGRSTSAGGPWYVTTTGNDANTCLSPATACLTIQAAIGKASSGDTVNVAAGTYYEHLTIGKSLTLQGEDRETTTVDGSGGGRVIYITANYVTVSGLKVTNGEYGIRLINNWAIHHVTMRDVVVTSNGKEGIGAHETGGYHLIEDCIISDNSGWGLYTYPFSYSTIRNCEVFGNSGGLHPGWGSYTLITNNEVHHNAGPGIGLDSMWYSTVENNEIYSNNTDGIIVAYVGRYNTIRDNVVRNNGLGLHTNWTGTYGNKFYHNDLIDNTQQACDKYANNIWDNGYPSGGNYWSDYTGVDVYSGAGQNVPGSDGIGDTPYGFSGGPPTCAYSQDNYPLMSPRNYVIQVTIDIKPGSDPNCINPDGHGVIPVAILTTATFDATTVDPATVALDGAGVAVRGKSDKMLAAIEDVDGDGDLDLVVKIVDDTLLAGSTTATLTGNLFDGTPITGTDFICIVPPES